MTRREVRIRRPLTVAEVQEALQALGPGVQVSLAGPGRVRVERGGRVGVWVRRWQSMIPGTKDKGTLLVVRADYPARVWWWAAAGVLPVFVAQAVYDRKVRPLALEAAGQLERRLASAQPTPAAEARGQAP